MKYRMNGRIIWCGHKLYLMITFAEMERRLRRLNILELAGLAIDDTKDEMLGEQKDQMGAGLLKTGKPITPLYSPSTVKKKKRKGQVSSHVTLEDTLEFKNGMFVDVREKTYIIDSLRKAKGGVRLSIYLQSEKKYTGKIWGLGGDYRSRYLAVLLKSMKRYVKKAIQ